MDDEDEKPKGRYLLFCGDNYYPVGGWDDFRGEFDTLDEARVEGRKCDWFHVIDRETCTRVE